MSASTYEYKTVALPQLVQPKRKRGMSEADLVAETLGELIHLEAVDGWEYMRSDILAAGGRSGMFSREARITQYTVLIFRRVQEGAWPTEAMMPRSAAAAGAQGATPAPKPAPAPVLPAKPLVDDPTSPLSRGDVLTTGGQFRTGEPVSAPPGTAPRPPLGSAQD